jgi:hypothetical protein
MSETEQKPERASEKDRAHMRKIGAAKRALAREGKPPASLAEMFARMEEIERRHGSLAKPRVEGGDGDLASHIAYLDRRRSLGSRRG